MKQIIKKIKERFPQACWLDDVQYVYVLASIVFFVGIALLVWFFSGSIVNRFSGNQNIINFDNDDASSEVVSCEYRRMFDGVCVSSSADIDPQLVAIMIENAADAWPLFGTADAQIVYEALVEGDIPRYMAVYTDAQQIEKIGPVRSARPYFVNWLSEYPSAMYMHVGGSPAGLELIKASSDIFDLNEFYRGWFFWRDKNRAAPHNVFTSSKQWRNALRDYGPDERTTVDPWLFETQDVCTEDCAQSIDVNFSAGIYNVTWNFVSSTGQYERSQGRGKDTDAVGNKIMADTIIVQYVDTKVIDDIGRKQMDVVGEGEVLVFQQGHATEGTWKKDSRKDRTHFFDSEGKMIPLKGGKIWIEIVPTFSEVVWNS